MRRGLAWRGVFVAMAVAALAGAALAGEAFEGKICFQVTAKQAGGKPMGMEYAVKKGIIRVEMKIPGMANYTLMDPATRKTTTVMPAQKMVMVMALPEAKAPVDGANPPEITKTGKTEKMTFRVEGTKLTLVKAGEDAGAGAKTVEAEQWEVKMPNGTAEVWVAKGLAPLAAFGEVFKPFQKGAQGAWMKDAKFEGYPCKTVTKDAQGNVQSEMELVSVDTKSPEDELFAIPDDYKKMEMPGMPAKQ